MTLKQLSKTIRSAREAKGLSQKAVAEKIGISKPHYFHLEHGVVWPRLNTAMKLSKVLKFSLAE